MSPSNLLHYWLLPAARDQGALSQTLSTPESVSLIEWRDAALSGNSLFALEISAGLLCFFEVGSYWRILFPSQTA